MTYYLFQIIMKVIIMSDMTEQEAWELDELLTNTTPEVSATMEGPFIKHHLTSQMLATKQTPAETSGGMIRREIDLIKTS